MHRGSQRSMVILTVCSLHFLTGLCYTCLTSRMGVTGVNCRFQVDSRAYHIRTRAGNGLLILDISDANILVLLVK